MEYGLVSPLPVASYRIDPEFTQTRSAYILSKMYTSTFDVTPSSSQLQLFLFDKRFDPALDEIVLWKTCNLLKNDE